MERVKATPQSRPRGRLFSMGSWNDSGFVLTFEMASESGSGPLSTEVATERQRRRVPGDPDS